MEIKNHGVILGQRDTDYIAGTLPYEIVNPTGDWTPYLPLGEYQRLPSYSFDTMACVTFSALNIIETLYFFITGVRRNFSDRFTARMSGTTQDGNWQWKVADSIRKAGIVDEELWPAPTSPSTTWGEYYSVPPIEVVNKALEFKNDWEVTYEFIDFTRESLLYHLKQAPIQVIIPGHAVMNFLTTDQVYKYFDSYSPFVKERVEPFVYAMKLILTKKTMKLTKEQVNGLYQLGFKRNVDSGGEATWVGKELDFVLDGLLNSKENIKYTPIFQAVKSLENDLRNGDF